MGTPARRLQGKTQIDNAEAASLKIAGTQVQPEGLGVADPKVVIGPIPLSFETGEVAAVKTYFNFKATINKIRITVMKLIEATNDGTVQGANSTGNSANGLATVTKASALETEFSVSPTTNNVVLANGYYKLTPAKVTAGGKVLAFLECTRTV